MQTTPLPGLNAGGSANAAPQRSGDADNGAQFSAALTQEISQRNTAAQQAPAANDGAARPQQPAPPQRQQAASADAPARQPAKADAKPADGKAAADDKDGEDKDAAANAAVAAAAPATDMLAMVASVAQLLQGAVAPTAAPALEGKPDAKGVASSAQLPGIGAATEGADLDTAIPTDAAARFAALMRSGAATQATAPAANHATADANARADVKPTTRGSAIAANTPAASQAPSAAPGSAPSVAPSAAPTGAPAALAAQLATAAAPEAKAPAPDAAAAQLLAAAQVQQAAPAIVQAQVVATQNYIPAQLGTPAWDNQVGQKVVWMVAGGEQSASLTLNPPDLGPLQVVLSVNGDQASVAFSSSHQDVRHALESALPRLREMMGESGIALGNATVDAGAGQRQPQDSWQGMGGQRASSGDGALGAADDTPVPRTATRTTVLGERGMVDTFA